MKTITVVTLILISFPSCSENMTKCGPVSTERFARALVSALGSYLAETSVFPLPEDPSATGDRLIATNTAEGIGLINTLCGFDRERNTKGTAFLQLSNETAFQPLPKEPKKYGVLYHSNGTRIYRLMDAWGNPYWIALDSNNDGKLEFQWSKTKSTLQGRRSAVMSAGPDGQRGTRDDVKTW
jgi:hypothetical protein